MANIRIEVKVSIPTKGIDDRNCESKEDYLLKDRNAFREAYCNLANNILLYTSDMTPEIGAQLLSFTVQAAQVLENYKPILPQIED